MKKVTIFIAFFSILLLILAGCTNKNNSSKEKKITIAMYRDGEINKIDPASSFYGPHIVYKMAYDGLVEDDGKKGVKPQLAKKWDISEDGKTYTFKLRKGVKFSDGTPFNADAVIYNLKRWVNDDANSALTSSNVEKIKALDDHTVQIRFNQKAYPILKELSYPRPVRFASPKSLKEKDENHSKKMPAGTGPWKVENYKKDKEFTMVPNPRYWGKKPKLDKIVFKVIPEDQSRILALKNKEVDITGGDLIGRIPIESIKKLDKDPKIKTYHKQTMSSYFIGFNQDNPLFQDKKVRLAMNYSINRKKMVDNLLDGIGSPAKNLFQPTVPYVNKSNNKGYGYNPKKAKQLLKEAGFKKNKDGVLEKNGKPFEIDMVLTTDEFPEWKVMSEYLQSEWKKVGIKVHLRTVNKNTYDDIGFKSRNYDLLMQRTASDSWVPHSELKQLFTKMKTNNKAKVWYDKSLTTEIDKTLSSMNEKERQDHYNNIFNFFHDESVAIPLYYPETVYAVNDNVEDFEPGVNAYAPIKWNELNIKK